jgi:hypothetical protein
MERQSKEVQYAICINDRGYEDDLKARTVYRVLSDASAARSRYLRIVDETGEDYLYPAAYFVLIDVPREAKRAFVSSRISSKSKSGIKTRRKSGGEHRFVA